LMSRLLLINPISLAITYLAEALPSHPPASAIVSKIPASKLFEDSP